MSPKLLPRLAATALAPGKGVRQGLGPAPGGLLWSVESSCRYALYFLEQHTRRGRGTALLCFALPRASHWRRAHPASDNP